jgi:flagellar export protein FliJ
MKSFRFRLERVLTWRGTRLSLAEAKLDQLIGELRKADDAVKRLLERRVAAQTPLARSAIVNGADLGVLETFGVWAVREEKRVKTHMIELRESIELQNRIVAEARREVKLVERLKQQKYESWSAEAEHEINELAAESAIAQWRRLNS